MGIIFGLLSSLAFALSFTLLKKSFKDFPPSIAFFFDMAFGVLILIPFSLILGFDFANLLQVAPYALISAVLSEAFVFYILSKGEISITGTIFASYPIYTILFAYIILGERLDTVHWIFILVTLGGTILSSLPEKISKVEFKKKNYILWAIAGAAAVGLSDTISKGVIDRTSTATFLFALAFMQIPISLIYLRIEKQSISNIFQFFKQIPTYKFPLLGSFFNVFGLVGLWLAFEYTLASIASPLTAAYPGIMVIIAIIFLKERPRKIELIGLFLILVGVIGISYYS
jgi:drug/metabolite transporter (DMT)-like permease